MTPEDFARQLCAELIRQGILHEDNAAHQALHRAARDLFRKHLEREKAKAESKSKA